MTVGVGDGPYAEMERFDDQMGKARVFDNFQASIHPAPDVALSSLGLTGTVRYRVQFVQYLRIVGKEVQADMEVCLGVSELLLLLALIVDVHAG